MEWFKEAEPAYLDKLFEKIIKARSYNIIEGIKRIKYRTDSPDKHNNLSIENHSDALAEMSSGIQPKKERSLISRLKQKRNSLAPVSDFKFDASKKGI